MGKSGFPTLCHCRRTAQRGCRSQRPNSSNALPRLAGEERERAGRCLAGLALQHVDETAGLCTFLRAGGGGFEGSALVEGEMVLLSIEGAFVRVHASCLFKLLNWGLHAWHGMEHEAAEH